MAVRHGPTGCGMSHTPTGTSPDKFREHDAVCPLCGMLIWSAGAATRCICNGSEMRAEIETLRVALRDVVVEAAEGSPLNLFDALSRAKDVLESGRSGS